MSKCSPITPAATRLTVEPPISDRSNCDSALEQILLLLRQDPQGRVAPVGPTPDPDPPGVDDVKVLDQISSCLNLKIN